MYDMLFMILSVGFITIAMYLNKMELGDEF